MNWLVLKEVRCKPPLCKGPSGFSVGASYQASPYVDHRTGWAARQRTSLRARFAPLSPTPSGRVPGSRHLFIVDAWKAEVNAGTNASVGTSDGTITLRICTLSSRPPWPSSDVRIGSTQIPEVPLQRGLGGFKGASRRDWLTAQSFRLCRGDALLANTGAAMQGGYCGGR
jgi:hypothetical protein